MPRLKNAKRQRQSNACKARQSKLSRMEPQTTVIPYPYIDEDDDVVEEIRIDELHDEEDEILDTEINPVTVDDFIEEFEPRWRKKGNNTNVRDCGTSRARKAKKLADSAVGTAEINSSYHSVSVEVEGGIATVVSNTDSAADQGEDFDSDEDDCKDNYKNKLTIYKAIQDLADAENAVSGRNQKNLEYIKLQTASISAYLRLINDGISKMEASRMAADVLFSKKELNSYKATCIRQWANYYLRHQKLKTSLQGKHIRTTTIITDEFAQQRLREILREMNDADRNPENFMKLLNSGIINSVSSNAPEKISQSTARRWMLYLGFKCTTHEKGARWNESLIHESNLTQ